MLLLKLAPASVSFSYKYQGHFPRPNQVSGECFFLRCKRCLHATFCFVLFFCFASLAIGAGFPQPLSCIMFEICLMFVVANRTGKVINGGSASLSLILIAWRLKGTQVIDVHGKACFLPPFVIVLFNYLALGYAKKKGGRQRHND